MRKRPPAALPTRVVNACWTTRPGSAELFHADTLLEILGPGDPFGEFARATRAQNPFALVTRSECSFALIDGARSHFLASSAPDFALRAMQVVVERLSRILPPAAVPTH